MREKKFAASIACSRLIEKLSYGINIGNSKYRHDICQKKLHRQIFRQKPLHRQFHLISTVLIITTQKMSENEEIYTAGKNFTLPPAVSGVTNIISV